MNIKELIKNIFKPKKSQNTYVKYYKNPNKFTLPGFNERISSIDDYENILSKDSHISSCFESLFDKICSLNFEIVTDKNRGKYRIIYEFVNNIFQNKLYTSRIIRNALKYLVWGKIISQIFYEIKDGYYIPTDIQLCNPDYFQFRVSDGHLIYLSNKDFGEEIDVTAKYPYQFVALSHNANALNPNGESILGEKGALLYHLKRNILKNYALTTELYANPNIHVKVKEFADNGTRLLSDTEVNQYLNEVDKKVINPLSNGIRAKIATTNLIDINYVAPNMAQMVDLQSAYEMLNRELSKLILGSTKVNESSEGTGSYALSQTHENTVSDRIEAICTEVEAYFDRIIEIIVNLNFDETDYYPFFKINYKRKSVDDKEFERITKLMEMGLQVSKKWIYEKYEIVEPEDENDTFGGSDNSNLETINNGEIDDVISTGTNELNQGETET